MLHNRRGWEVSVWQHLSLPGNTKEGSSEQEMFRPDPEGWVGVSQAENGEWRRFLLSKAMRVGAPLRGMLGKLRLGPGKELHIPLEVNPAYLETQWSWMALIIFSVLGPSRWVADKFPSCKDRSHSGGKDIPGITQNLPLFKSHSRNLKGTLISSRKESPLLSHYIQSRAQLVVLLVTLCGLILTAVFFAKSQEKTEVTEKEHTM